MPEFSLFLLKPSTPFHIGERGVGMEETSEMVHSDTLFGAVCWAWKLLYGEKDLLELLNQFLVSDPPFLISSAFPYIGETLLLPKPLEGFGQAGYEKKVRRAWLVSLSIFQDMAQGKGADGYELIPGDALVTPEEASKIRDFLGPTSGWVTGESPRVTLDRNSMQSEIYHSGDLWFAKGCGLYMLADFRHPDSKNKLEGALRLLGDEGLGGERSSGRGLFSVEQRSVSLGAEDGERSVLLSLYRPRREEAPILGSSSYSLISRRGWSASKLSQRKRSLRMLAEGSIIPFKPNTVLGSLEDVGSGETNKVYSYGLAFHAPAGGMT